MRPVEPHPLSLLIPGIIEPDGTLSPYIPHMPYAHQIAFLALPDREAFFGGAAGPGKSDALLMGGLQYVHVPGYSSLILRRTYKQLARSGGLLQRAAEWLTLTNAHSTESGKVWTFPQGGHYQGRTGEARLEFGYLDGPRDHYEYQSTEYKFIGYDEVTQFQEHQYLEPGMSRVRGPSPREEPDNPLAWVPDRTRSASNPGDLGHDWVKARFVDPATAIAPFIPGILADNPAVNREAYRESLMHLHPTRREQMLNGDWDARDPGDYWRREWIGYVERGPGHAMSAKIRMWDLAASEKETACWTCGTLVSLDVHGFYTTEHSVRFRLTPGKRNARIKAQAIEDGRQVVVGVEEEPGSGGIDQALRIKEELESLGFRVWVFNPGHAKLSKTQRADPVAAQAEDGMWRVAVGSLDAPEAWVSGYMSRMEGFPSGAVDHDNKAIADDMDSTSGAFKYLVEHPPKVRTWEPVGRAVSRPFEGVGPSDPKRRMLE